VVKRYFFVVPLAVMHKHRGGGFGSFPLRATEGMVLMTKAADVVDEEEGCTVLSAVCEAERLSSSI